MLRATIEQSRHRFDAARALLDRALEQAPTHVQARLTRANDCDVRGDIEAARADCDALREPAPTVSMICRAIGDSLSGNNAKGTEGARRRDRPIAARLGAVARGRDSTNSKARSTLQCARTALRLRSAMICTPRWRWSTTDRAANDSAAEPAGAVAATDQVLYGAGSWRAGSTRTRPHCVAARRSLRRSRKRAANCLHAREAARSH